MSGLSSLTGGGGLSASSSAKSGDSSSGAIGININGINTGAGSGNTSSVPSYVWMGALALLALIALKFLRK